MTLTTTPFPSVAQKSALPAQALASPTYNQAVIAVAVSGRHVVTVPGLLESVVVNVGTTGTVTDTIFRMQRIPAGTAVAANIDAAATTVAQTAADGVVVVVPIGLQVNVGDVIQMNVTQAPTGGANLAWAPVIMRQFSSNP